MPAYRTRQLGPEDKAEVMELFLGGIDVVLFTSSSTVDSLVAALGADALGVLANTTLASIGPITTQTAEGLGLRIDVTADEYTVDGLLDALEDHMSERRTP